MTVRFRDTDPQPHAEVDRCSGWTEWKDWETARQPCRHWHVPDYDIDEGSHDEYWRLHWRTRHGGEPIMMPMSQRGPKP
jgi:hypothetical protein